MKKIEPSVWQNDPFIVITHVIDFPKFNTNITFKEIYPI